MPKTLSNRLEDLENEIHVMLTLQEPGKKSCCSNVVKGASITTHAGGNVDKLVFEGLGCQTQQTGKAIMSLPSNKSNSRPSSSPGPGGRKRRNSGENVKSGEDHGDDARRACSGGCRRKPVLSEGGCNCGPPKKQSPCICGPRREAALKKCICGPDRARKLSAQGGGIASGSVGGIAGLGGGTLGGLTEEEIKKMVEEETARQAEMEELSKAREDDQRRLEESETAYTNLKMELERMQLQLSEAEHDKKMAMSMTNELKEKYDKIRTHKSAETEELHRLKKEKEELNKKLEKEAETRRTLEEQAKENVEKEKKALTEKVEKIELHAAKSAKKVKKHSNKLATAVRQRDDHIRRLSGTTEKLAESIRDKEIENKKLAEAHKEMIQNLIESQAANKKLADTNTALVKNVKECQEKFQAEKSTVQKLQKQVSECRDEFRKCTEEMDRLKERLKQALQGPKDIRDMARLQAKLREARERERRWLDEQALLEAKMKELQDNQENASRKSDDELDRMIKEHKKLQAKFEELTRKLQFTVEEHQAKIANMEEEFKSYSQEMQAKHDNLLKEKEELQADFDNLTNASKRDRQVLQDLITRTQQQDLVIRTQQEAIAARDEKIVQAQMEICQLNEQRCEMENHINKLQQNLEKSEMAYQETRREIGNLTNQLRDTREQIVMKDKAIAEQISKIEDLKATVLDRETKLQSAMEEIRIVSEEARRSIEQNKALSMQLEKEKAEKTTAIKQMRSDKVDIKEKVVKLETTVEEFCKCAGDSKQQKLISSLEQKAVLLQKENNLQMQLVLKQKDQALNAARFATQKLLETVCDFQNQVEAHKKIQYMLTKMLHEKEEQMKKMCPYRCPKPRKVSKSNCSNPNCSGVRFRDEIE